MTRPLMGGRRSAIEILFEMLAVCRNGGVNKTAIMYMSNLSYDQLLRYLAFLGSHSLVSKDPLTGQYHITHKGLEALEQVEAVINLLREMQMEEVGVAARTANGPIRAL